MAPLSPSKLSLNDRVEFRAAGGIFTGAIEGLDFAHFSNQPYHSYNIYVKEQECSFTHVPEVDILKKF